MKSIVGRFTLGLVAACCLASTGAIAQESWPNRAVRLIVPFPAGGGVDTLSRSVAEMLGKKLGQQFVVENRPGAATMIAAEQAERSAADGYTAFVATTSTLVSNRYQFQKLRYDPDGFVPVSLLGFMPLVFLTNNETGVNDIQGMLEYARKNPMTVSYASFGSGTNSHLATEILSLQANAPMTHVPFKGASEALPALIGNQVQFYADTITSSYGFIKDGRLKALGTTIPQRTKTLPDVKTVAEQGFPGYDMSSWAGIVFPKNVPSIAVTKMDEALQEILRSKEFEAKLLSIGQELSESQIGAAAFKEQIRKDIPLVKSFFEQAKIEPK